jgi:recombinational DNA repair ATPase RecF
MSAVQQEQILRLDALVTETKKMYAAYFVSLRRTVRNPNAPIDMLEAAVEQTSVLAQVLTALGEDMQAKSDEALAGLEMADRLLHRIASGRVTAGQG